MNPTRRMRRGFEHRYTVDEWDERDNLVREIFGSANYDEAAEAFESAVREFPKQRLTMRHGARVIRKHSPDSRD